MARQNIILENLHIDRVAAEGKCVSKVDGKVIFTSKTAPGDIIDARVTKKKKNYVEATPIRYLQKSALRVEPVCTHFELCGGCKWQHLPYESQLEFKQQQVIDQLQRIGKLDTSDIRPILGSAKIFKYRNKLEYTFTNYKWLTEEQIQSGEEINRNGVGFHLPGRFSSVLDIDNCHLQKEPSNEIRLFVKFFALRNNLTFYNVKVHKGLLRNMVVRTTEGDDLMIIMQFGEDNLKDINLLMKEIKEHFPEITSLNYVINTKKNDAYYDQEVIHFSGKAYITEVMDGISFKIGPKSFFQTNSTQAIQLYEKAIELAGLNGQQITYDLYCGTGTISNLVSSKSLKVIGIEYIPEAILDARENSKRNGITNTYFEAADIKDILNKEYFELHGTPDVIITDPPRAGMHQEVVASINASGAEKVVYISCNPATQARDLELMTNYDISTIQPVDMFPHTHHVENIVLMTLKSYI